MSLELVAHPDVIRSVLNRLWQAHRFRFATADECAAFHGISVRPSPFMAKHPTVRMDLHAPPPRFIEYEKSDEDWLRYFGYIREFEYEDTSQHLMYQIDTDAFSFTNTFAPKGL